MICYPATTDWGCITQTELEELDDVVKARSEALAWTTLQRLTGGNVAICPTLVRPCAIGCSGKTWYVAPVTGASGFTPYVGADGNWYNACGCGSPSDCSCTTIQQVILPGMVGGIAGVYIDGVALAATEYRVDNGNRLVRTDGELWPICQDMNQPWDAVGSFAVRYYDGVAPNSSLDYAAGVLALEYYKACTNGACQLPSGVTNVVRQGVSMEIANGLFINGYTGIKVVDSVISIYNPFGNKVRPVVMSPDVQPARTQTWGRF
jgi:hypothetical protein